MYRSILTVLMTTLVLTAVAQAHFVFVVPDVTNPAKIVVVFSENLEVDENIPADRLKGLKLTGRFDGGKEAPVECKPGMSCLTGELGLVNPQCVFGSHVIGVLQRGDAKPYLLAYHPKAVFAGADSKHLTLDPKQVPVELVPVLTGDQIRFRLLAQGKPVGDTEVTVLKPEGGKSKVKTDQNGLTSGFPAKGQYGAWARHFVSQSGEHEGKSYEEARHYATLVVHLATK